MTHKPDDMPLLPCPFCGGAGHIEELTGVMGDAQYQANCSNEECLAYQFLLHSYERKVDAGKIWNTRADRVPIEPGWVMVPVEPTYKIKTNIQAAAGSMDIPGGELDEVMSGEGSEKWWDDLANKVWKWAIEAAPPAPSDPLVDVLGEALREAVEWAHHVDWSNGNTDPTGSIDEGSVNASKGIVRWKAALAQYNARKGRAA